VSTAGTTPKLCHLLVSGSVHRLTAILEKPENPSRKMENNMRAKLLAGAAAIALAACTAMASAAPASAAPWGWHGGWGWGGGLAGGIIGGTIAAATSPLWAPGYYSYGWGPGYDVYDYAPGPAVTVGGGGVGWCEARFRSYNPATGMYLGYDGVYHHCP
jgi:hypothetical protein